MSETSFYILFRDALLGRKAFAGPYEDVPEADIARLDKAGHQEVEFVRTRNVARWMPPLRIELPVTAGTLREAAEAGSAVGVMTSWDNVAQAFVGQLVEMTALDGEKFDGWVSEIDVARCTVWVGLEASREEET